MSLAKTLFLHNAISFGYFVVLIGPRDPQQHYLESFDIIRNILMGSRCLKGKTLFRNSGLSSTAPTSQERADILSTVYILFLLASLFPAPSRTSSLGAHR